MRQSTKDYIELYRRGEWDRIPIGYDKAQRAFYYLAKKQLITIGLLWCAFLSFIGYGGGARSGKTQLEVFWVLFGALAYEDTGWFLARRELKLLRLTALLTLFRTMQFYGLKKDVDYTYNKIDHVITFKHNGSQIFLIDLAYSPSDPEYTWLGGYEFTAGAVDESNESERKAIETINARCGWRNNLVHDIPANTLETFNPGKGHEYERFWAPFRDNEQRGDTRFIRALPSDNPHPAVRLWVERLLRSGNDSLIERYIRGNFDYDDDPTRLFDHQEILNSFTNNFVKPARNNREKFITVDAARQGKDGVPIWYWSGLRATLYKFLSAKDMAEIDPVTNRPKGLKKAHEEIEKLRIKMGVPQSNVAVDEDGVGGGLVDMGGYTGFQNGSRALKGENYKNLKCQCSFMLSELFNSGEIKITVPNKNLKDRFIRELGAIKDITADKDAPKEITKKQDLIKFLGASPDLHDGLIIRVLFMLIGRLSKARMPKRG